MARALTAALVGLALVLLGAAVAVARALDRRGAAQHEQTRRTLLGALERLRADLTEARTRTSDRPTPPTPPSMPPPPPVVH